MNVHVYVWWWGVLVDPQPVSACFEPFRSDQRLSHSQPEWRRLTGLWARQAETALTLHLLLYLAERREVGAVVSERKLSRMWVKARDPGGIMLIQLPGSTVNPFSGWLLTH